MSEWIDINEKQPRAGERCLIAATDPDGGKHVGSAKWQHKRFYLTGHCAYWHVTHWMELPEHPEVEE